MIRTRRFVSALLPLLLAAPAAAQMAGNDASHIPIPRAANSDPAKLFAERIEQAKLRAGLPDLPGLLKQLPPLPAGGANEEWRKQVQRQLLTNPELQKQLLSAMQSMGLDSEALNRYRGLLGPELARQGLPPELLPQILQQLDKLSLPEPTPIAPRPGEGRRSGKASPDAAAPRGQRSPSRPDPSPQEKASREAWTRRITEWAQRFPQDKLAEPLRNSSAVQNLLRNMTQTSVNALGGDSTEGLDAQLARWEGYWRTLRERLPPGWAEGLTNRLSDLPRPNVQLPDLDWNPPGVGLTAPSLTAPVVDPSGLGSAILIVLGLALAAVVFWRLQAVRAAPGGQRSLGPWPLDPQAVATRTELIQAFEYLSLVRCGEAARSWHHRALAERLGGSEAGRRDAATRLATLYEHARYAPVHLPEPDWTAARRPLTLLSGTGMA